jgi:hypothetical protein
VVRPWAANEFFAIDGTKIFYFENGEVRGGEANDPSTDATLAAVPLTPASTTQRSFFTTTSYVYFWGASGGAIVHKTSHTVATFTFDPNFDHPSDTVAGNDEGLYFTDEYEGYLWRVPLAGGPAIKDTGWNAGAIAADESGVYVNGAYQGGPSGLHKVTGGTVTMLAAGTRAWSLQLGAQHVYGSDAYMSSTDCHQSIELWSVPKSGGGATTLLSSPVLIGATFSAFFGG